MFGSLMACQIKTAYAADSAGKYPLPERLPTFANLAGLGSNRKSGTAYRGTGATTWTLLHLSTKTDTKLCPGEDRAETPIAYLPTTSVPRTKLNK
jgi:hypothetical protein